MLVFYFKHVLIWIYLKVGYEVGSKGTSLPSNYTKDFDAALIPVIMDNIANGIDNPLVMELIFHILVKWMIFF